LDPIGSGPYRWARLARVALIRAQTAGFIQVFTECVTCVPFFGGAVRWGGMEPSFGKERA